MNTYSHLTPEQISNAKVGIVTLSCLILFFMTVILISLKNGIAYGRANISREKSPVMYWLSIILNIVIIFLFTRELYRTLPVMHDVFP